MPKCQICTHPSKLLIERELIKGTNMLALSRQWNVSASSLQRHKDLHISRQLVQAYDRKHSIENMDLLGDIEQLISRTKTILETAEQEKKFGLALSAIREVRGSYELLSKIAFALNQARQSEIELEKVKKGYDQEIASEKYSGKLKALTVAELLIFSQLIQKIENQSKEIIIPDESNSSSLSPRTISGNKSISESNKPSQHRAKSRRTKFSDDSSPDMAVRPINPEKIQFTPFSQSPLF